MTSSAAVEVEFAARAIAAHLLDAGFSSDHLFRWLQARGPVLSTLSDLIADLAAMAERMPVKTHEVFVPCAAPFDKPTTNSQVLRWLDGPAATAWLASKVPGHVTKRESAGFVLTVQERDPWAALDAARALVARADARVRVAHPSSQMIRLAGWARIAGSGREYPMPVTPRHVEIGSLYRQQAIYQLDDSSPTGIDDALELASYMESPSTGAAIAGGWSAIEGLLIRPGEGSHHLAADRLAALVTCSLPRAEMTSLAYRHVDNGNDDLASALSSAPTNFERVRLVEERLRGDGRLALTDRSDLAAENRVVKILREPAGELERIRAYTTESLRRLYSQRNMVVHAGSLQSLVLPATIRTAFSLVGAGLDRIVHAQLETRGQLQPLSLVARAETELRLLGTDGARRLGELLN